MLSEYEFYAKKAEIGPKLFHKNNVKVDFVHLVAFFLSTWYC